MEKQRETHPPPTLNTKLAGGDGEIAPWSQQFEKYKHFWKFTTNYSVPQTFKT